MTKGFSVDTTSLIPDQPKLQLIPQPLTHGLGKAAMGFENASSELEKFDNLPPVGQYLVISSQTLH
ncbi:hypothetical protein ACJ72_04156 [Emergomyces africanus]|uniref:Uncharacterized protein n=1 Tax=Emergomyces africanus TaxID=1955775 RepID=A0A1B7NXH9_9EURO|nr:hypothetical protein ACJ72_04156 [Emergomyces africanus]